MHLRKVFTVLSLVFLLTVAGCQSANEDTAPDANSDKELLTATIQLIDAEENEVDSKTVEFQEGETLMDIAKENFEVIEVDGFINGIGDLVPDSDKQEFVSITVNGEMAMAGANELELKADDKVTFSIEVWE